MAAIQWTIDTSHTEIGFKIKHMMVSNVRGVFSKYTGTVETEGSDFSVAKVELDIDVASVDTNNTQRDTHLRSKDFFEAETYKNMVFKSTKVEKVDDSNFKLTGDLTIKNNTLPVTLDVEMGGIVNDPYGNTRAGFSVSGKLSRKAFGLSWNGTLPGGDSIVGDEITINCEIEITHR
ncbi:MAG: YceI family protein [Tannerellaceae bacterium]